MSRVELEKITRV